MRGGGVLLLGAGLLQEMMLVNNTGEVAAQIRECFNLH